MGRSDQALIRLFSQGLRKSPADLESVAAMIHPQTEVISRVATMQSAAALESYSASTSFIVTPQARIDAPHPAAVGPRAHTQSAPKPNLPTRQAPASFSTAPTSPGAQVATSTRVDKPSEKLAGQHLPAARPTAPEAPVAPPAVAVPSQGDSPSPVEAKQIPAEPKLEGSKSQVEVVPTVASPADPKPQSVAAKHTPVSTKTPTAAAPEPFVPAWEVERFALPAIAKRLLHDCAGLLAHVVDQLLAQARTGHKTIVIASHNRGEGRTTLGLCLAQLAAMRGQRVALVDADLENPAIGQRLGLDLEVDWLKAIAEEQPLGEAAVRSTHRQWTIAPLSARPTAATLPTPQRVAAMLRELAAVHDLVLVDSGPLAPSSAAAETDAAISPIAASLLVRDPRQTSDEDLARLLDELKATGLSPVGMVENFTEAQSVDAAE